MKAENFVIIFFLLLVGAYFTYSKHAGNFGNHASTIEIKNDNMHEEIEYAGIIEFTDSEDAIKSISTGGFINYTMNGEKMKAKSDRQGHISYELYDGDYKMSLDSNGKKLIGRATKEMIAWGINAGERMERLSRIGGNRALINELANLKNDNVKRMYFEHILHSDSLSEGDLTELATKVCTYLSSDQDRLDVLKKFKVSLLLDSTTIQAYLKTVGRLGDDYLKSDAIKYILPAPMARQSFPALMDLTDGIRDENEKAGLLSVFIQKGRLEDEQIDKVIASCGSFNDDMLKENLLSQLMNRDSISSKHFDKLLEQINHVRDENDKQVLYKKFIDSNSLTEDQWISLTNQTGNLSGDEEKGNFLLQIWPKIPKTEKLKAAYLNNAKAIRDDFQYGRVVRVAS